MKIVLKNLTKRFPNRNKKIKEDVIAVSGFDFEIPDGKLIGLLGPSGCGKSTTLNMICGLEKPTEGRIFFGDDDVTDLPPENRGVGMVFQSYALYPHMTVLQNIMFPLENLKGKDKMTKKEMIAKAEEAARLVQIDQRCQRVMNLPTRIPREDIELAARAYGIGGSTACVENILSDIRMNRLTSCLALTASWCAGNNKSHEKHPLNWESFRAVYRSTLGEV